MVEIKTREGLEAWLKDRPREDAVALAARAALRVLPLVVTVPGKDAVKRSAVIVLPVFRATAATWVAAVGPTQGTEVRKAAHAAAAAPTALAAAADAAADAADVVSSPAAAHAAAHAADAATAAATENAVYAVDAEDGAGATEAAADFAAAAAAASSWTAVSIDATMLEQGQSTGQVAAMPLWSEARPNQIAKTWAGLREHLLDADEGWEVWTTWYDDRLHGRPFNKSLEEARVLIDPALWDQGPKAVNAEIARLVEKHKKIEAVTHFSATGSMSSEAEVVRIADKLETALTSVELRAALADFKLDDLARLMRMVRFAEDLRDLDNPLLEKDRAGMLSELADGMANLAKDIQLETGKGNVPGWLRREIGRYAKEAALGPASVRPRFLWDIAAGLAGALKDPDIEEPLGDHLFGRLERLVEKHLDLMRDYFATALARLRPLDKIETAPGTTPETMLDVLGMAVERMESGNWESLPPPEEEITAVMADRVEELRGILDRINRTTNHQKRRDRLETFWRKAKLLAMTVLRYGASAARAGVVGVGSAAATQTLWPEWFAATLDAIRNLFSNIPWPF